MQLRNAMVVVVGGWWVGEWVGVWVGVGGGGSGDGSCCGGRGSGGSRSGYEKEIVMQRVCFKERETTETCAHVKFRCREAIPQAHTTTTTNTATTHNHNPQQQHHHQQQQQLTSS
jgi:hypothetical protein